MAVDAVVEGCMFAQIQFKAARAKTPVSCRAFCIVCLPAFASASPQLVSAHMA